MKKTDARGVGVMDQVSGLLAQLSLKELTALTELAKNELYVKQAAPMFALLRLLAAMPESLVFRPIEGAVLVIGLNKIGGQRTASDIGDITEIVVECLRETAWEWKVEHSQHLGMKIFTKVLLRPMPSWLVDIGIAMAEDGTDSVSGGDLYDLMVNMFKVKNPPKKQTSILPEELGVNLLPE